MAMLSPADDSLQALEALLAFRHGITIFSRGVHHEIPVPDPLNPLLPHVIEGDSTTPMNHSNEKLDFAGVQKIMPSHRNAPSLTPSVPNPLDLLTSGSVAEPSSILMHSIQHQSNDSSEQKCLPSTADKSSARDDGTKPPVNITDGGVASPTLAVRTDMIQDALNSRPQRGKKRHNLNDQERLELTRTRNRGHAKYTRMKKKARHLQLVEMEKMHLILKAQQELNHHRKTLIVKIIEGVSSVGKQQEVKNCPYIAHLKALAGEKLQHAQVAIIGGTPEDEVAVSASNSANVIVSINGTDYASGKSRSMKAILSAIFQAASTDISSISLLLIAQDCYQYKMIPSISALSFET